MCESRGVIVAWERVLLASDIAVLESENGRKLRRRRYVLLCHIWRNQRE